MNNIGLDIYLETWGVADKFGTLLTSQNLLLGSSVNQVLRLLGLLFLFCLILAGAVYTTRLVGTKAVGMRNNNIKVIETYRLSTSSAIQIIRVADKYMAVAISKEKITFLAELQEDSIIMNESASELQSIPFNEILKKAKDKIKSSSKKVD